MSDPVLGVIVLVAASALLAGVLRAARIPGGAMSAAIAGGLLAGLLLGPLVLGKVDPARHERWFVGGVEQRERLDELRRDFGADVTALSAVGAHADALAEREGEYRAAAAPIEAELVKARRGHAANLLGPFIGIFAAGVLLAARAGCHGPLLGAMQNRSGPDESAQARTGSLLADAALPAAMLVVFSALPTAILGVWLLGLGQREALALGAAVAAGSAFAGLPLPRPCAPGQILTSRALATLACLLSVGLLVASVPSAILWVTGPVGAYLLGLLLGRFGEQDARARSAARSIVLAVVVPALAAAFAVRVDPGSIHGWRVVLFVVLGVVLSGDGHLIGSWLGAHMGGHAWRGRAHLVLLDAHASGLSATQIALGLILVAGGVLDPSSPPGAAACAGLALGAFAAELIDGPTRRMASALDPGTDG